jgi:hypothetical protein
MRDLAKLIPLCAEWFFQIITSALEERTPLVHMGQPFRGKLEREPISERNGRIPESMTARK